MMQLRTRPQIIPEFLLGKRQRPPESSVRRHSPDDYLVKRKRLIPVVPSNPITQIKSAIAKKAEQNVPVYGTEVQIQHVQTKPFESKPIPLKPISADSKVQKKDVFVDGLNLVCNLLHKINTSADELGLMSVDREAELHQIDSTTDMEWVCDYIGKFMDNFPAGTQIHFVFKPFGSTELWNSFIQLFVLRFMDQPQNHLYSIYVAIPETDSDPECDDRLVARLAIIYGGLILSADKYRSMHEHWRHPSHYQHITNASDINPPIQCLTSCRQTQMINVAHKKFNFVVKEPNPFLLNRFSTLDAVLENI